MSRTAWIALLFSVAFAGCRGEVTGPIAGLPAVLTLSAAPVPPYPDPVIASVRDSLVVQAVIGTSGCYDYTAVAARVGSELVLTIEGTEAARACLAVVIPLMARVSTRGVPEGRYDVVLRLRTISRAGQAASPVELARGTVVLP